MSYMSYDWGMGMDTSMTVRVPAELRDRYERLSRQTGRPSSAYVRQAMDEAIGEFEWLHRIVSESEQWRAGRLQTYTPDEVRERLGLDA